MNEKKYINLLDVLAEEHEMPEGFDSWGIKSVGFDGRTRNNFQWPEPGWIAKAPGMLDHDSSCPIRPGDGLCVATNWSGMASSGFRAFCLLLVAYRSREARGRVPGKLRVPEVAVVARIDGERLIRDRGARANLRGANLRGAHLRSADLRGADLRFADLSHASLNFADLEGAVLTDVDLFGADLYGANLRGVNLRSTNLVAANMRGAQLAGADLGDTNPSDHNWGADGVPA